MLFGTQEHGESQLHRCRVGNWRQLRWGGVILSYMGGAAGATSDAGFSHRAPERRDSVSQSPRPSLGLPSPRRIRCVHKRLSDHLFDQRSQARQSGSPVTKEKSHQEKGLLKEKGNDMGLVCVARTHSLTAPCTLPSPTPPQKTRGSESEEKRKRRARK
jgi:hypothetical protein